MYGVMPNDEWGEPGTRYESEEVLPTNWVPEVGDYVIGLYRCQGKLGEGAMGRVDKFLHVGMQLELAV